MLQLLSPARRSQRDRESLAGWPSRAFWRSHSPKWFGPCIVPGNQLGLVSLFLCTSTVTDLRLTTSLTNAPQAATPGIEDVNCQFGLRAQVMLPGCWDGVNLDSAFYEVLFNVAHFNGLNDGGRFVLANGDPTGYGLHADFMNGWDSSVLSRAVSTCTAASGQIQDCPVFANEGRIISHDDANACSATNPFPQEVIGPGNLLHNLPGCVAVTEGPAPASPEDLVPGCVPGSVGGSGNGNGTSSVSLASNSLSSNSTTSTPAFPLGASNVSLASDPSAPKSLNHTPAALVGDSVASNGEQFFRKSFVKQLVQYFYHPCIFLDTD